MPDLVRYQVWDGPHGREPTTERGEIERLAREAQTADCQACLDRTVIETRFNVVRSSVPHRVATVRKLRDYLPPDDPAGAPKLAEELAGQNRHGRRSLVGTRRLASCWRRRCGSGGAGEPGP